MLLLASQALKIFKIKYPMVPIQGMIENHILAIRPSDTPDGLILKLLEEAEDQSTIDLLKKPGIRIQQHNMLIIFNQCGYVVIHINYLL